MAGDASVPLLHPQWSQADQLEEQPEESPTVAELLKEHPHDAIRYLQCSGVAKLGEFSAPDSLVFPAFQREPLLVLGSDSRKIDIEREWGRVLKACEEQKKCSGWSTDVTVEAFVVNVRRAADPDKDGLLQPLLKRWQARRCTYSVFALPAVQGVVTWKWQAFAWRMLLVELFFFLLWLLSFNTWAIAFQDEDLSLSLRELLRTPQGRVEVVAEALALLGMLPFLLLEVGTVPAYGKHWLDFWNGLDLTTYTIQIALTVMHLTRWRLESDWLLVLPAMQSILLVLRLQYLTQAFHATRFNFMDTINEVMQDLRWYLLFLLLVMYGFGCAFHIVFRRDQEGNEEYDTIIHSWLSCFEHQYGDIELKSMWKSASPVAATALGVLYTVVMGLVLINLLIGVVLNSLERATEHQDMKLLLSKARIIDELESTMPSWIERRNPSWYPNYVHMLRINPNKLDQVEVDALWSRMGEDSPPLFPAGGGHPPAEGPQFSELGMQEEEPPPTMAGSEGAVDGGAGEGGGGSGNKAAGRNGGGGRGDDSTEEISRRLGALQHQLEEHNRLLRRLFRGLEPGVHDAEE